MQNANNNAPNFKTVNPHSEKFNEFGNTRLFDRLNHKFTPKPYHHQYRVLRAVVFGASFLFHVLSAATAFFFIYGFIGKLIPAAIVSGVLTFAALAALELSKRETSGRLFHDYLQFGKLAPSLLAAVVGLALISTTCSYFGAERVVLALTPPPTLVNPDSLTAPLKGNMATIDQQIKAATATTWKGKVTTRAQRTIEHLTRQRETSLAELVRIQERSDNRNDATELQHTTTTATNATAFATFTAVCELLLVLCLFYLQYYDYRSFAEYAKSIEGKRDAAHQASNGFTATPVHAASNGNGSPQNETRRPIGFVQGFTRANDDRTTMIVQPGKDNLRTCEKCGQSYVYAAKKQRFCSEVCRINAWQSRTGRTLKRQRGEL